MACSAVNTGGRFIAETLAHIDCQAQAIGAYGFGALSDPSSPLAIALTGLLTIFVAIFGLRLMAGDPVPGRAVLGDVVRIGVVLALATSWPAWRTIGYDLVMRGPAEVAGLVGGAADLPGTQGDALGRLQAADDRIVELTIYGTGRMTGGTTRSDSIGDSFRGMALADQEGLARGRLAFLVGTLAPMAIVRLGAGLLLALAPLMAGLLLFAGTRDIFFGWLRGLAALALGGIGLAIVHGVELAVLEPWAAGAIVLRSQAVLAPSVPIELAAITYSFALASFGMLALVARIAFFGGFGMPHLLAPAAGRTTIAPEQHAARTAAGREAPSRAFLVAEAVSAVQRRETLRTMSGPGGGASGTTAADARMPARLGDAAPRRDAPATGDSGGRRASRPSISGQRRDKSR